MVAESSKDAGVKGANCCPPQSPRNSSDNSLPRVYSLKEDLAIKRVFRSGNKFKGSYLSIYYYDRDELPLKIVLRVSKKNGSAPRRNKIKRIIREIIRINKCLFEPFGHIAVRCWIDPKEENLYEIIKKDLLDFAGSK